MPPLPRLTRLTVEDVERAAAVLRYVADRTPSIDEFEQLADLLGICAEAYAEERRLFDLAKNDPRGRS